MPRRREVQKRETPADPKHGDKMVGQFINVLMSDGKKSTAESIIYGAFDEIEQKIDWGYRFLNVGSPIAYGVPAVTQHITRLKSYAGR